MPEPITAAEAEHLHARIDALQREVAWIFSQVSPSLPGVFDNILTDLKEADAHVARKLGL